MPHLNSATGHAEVGEARVGRVMFKIRDVSGREEEFILANIPVQKQNEPTITAYVVFQCRLTNFKTICVNSL